MVSVAALDTSTGARFAAGARKGMWMASTYKLLVLENLLAVQQDDGGLSAGELATAQSAIENSDNVAGYQLYLDAGGISALTALTNRLHMRHTVPWAADPTFTSTSAPDCLKLLHALVRPNATLNANSREQALGLMRNVEADQRWGVGVDADRGTSFANKNGWLAVDNSNGYGHDDDDRWIVTSLGVVTVRGHQLLLAALTQHNESMATGVALVQRLARLVATAVGDQPHAAG
jgi:beta-lactamase class A